MVSRRRQRRQSGGRQTGGGWSYSGSTFASAGGTPLDVRSVTNDCELPARVAPVQLGGGCGCNKQIGGSRRRRGRRSQRGGSCGVPLPQTGGGCGVPLPQRGGSCGVPLPQPQTGGGCGCSPLLQQGGGGGTGGYTVDVRSNDLGKVATYVPGSCSQRGGEYPLIPTHTASYSVTDPVLLDSGARYMEVTAGQKAGTRRRSRHKSRKSRQSRRRH